MPYKLDVTYNEIMNLYTARHRDSDREGIKRAYQYACEKHEGVKRGSGEPYIFHPMRVARILAEQGFESDYLMSALLHDVVEDCDVPVSEIRRLFGDTVAKTVDAVTALSDRDFGENKPSKKKRDSLSDVKLQENMTVKALYVKIADRIDNLSTISGVKEEKRMPKAKHTQEILIPMAERAKAYYYVDILEDLCFRIEHPGLVGLMEKIRDRICAENRLATGKSLLAFEKIFDHKRKSPDKMLEPYRRNIIEFRQQDRSMVSLYRQITREMRNSNELERIFRKDNFAFYDLFLIVSNDLEEEGTRSVPTTCSLNTLNWPSANAASTSSIIKRRPTRTPHTSCSPTRWTIFTVSSSARRMIITDTCTETSSTTVPSSPALSMKSNPVTPTVPRSKSSARTAQP